MASYIDTVMHPERYHGQNKRPPFFEGWYFKLIDASEQHKYAVIPGIFLSDDPAKHHAFVQVLDGQTGGSAYYTFPAEQFSAAPDDFDVRLGTNHFRADSITLNLTGGDFPLNGELRFQSGAPWPVTWRAPGIMGWYGWLSFMECYHGVVSFDHRIDGALTLGGRALDFTGGRGYIEKDWGKSFPSAWVWMQTNHFAQPGTCLTASIAVIPFIGRSFPGFIIGLWHEQHLFRFATYTGARTDHLEITDDTVHWVVSDRQHRLEMRAARREGGLLHGPSRTEMHKRVTETLKASVQVRLTDLNGRERFSGTGQHAGLEVQGDLTTLR
jgi:hypothetical protein